MADDRWVFGYGSLMWQPGFAHVERVSALLHGWHRAFSLLSHETWGTAERPGLAAALHPGGACRGVAFRIAAADWAEVETYLNHRERAYRRIPVTLRHADGAIDALTYVFDPAHPRAAGKLPLRDAARLIAQGVGRNGTSRSYFFNTYDALLAMGSAPGRQMRALHAAVRAELGQDANR